MLSASHTAYDGSLKGLVAFFAHEMRRGSVGVWSVTESDVREAWRLPMYLEARLRWDAVGVVQYYVIGGDEFGDALPAHTKHTEAQSQRVLVCRSPIACWLVDIHSKRRRCAGTLGPRITRRACILSCRTRTLAM